ncbi:MAG TPA: ATP-binding protein [Longimicrobiaceae bacterium]|nr:ATP-binding protein [Longimicrobiaceae bacterium]
MNDNEILQQEIGALQRRLDQLDERTRAAWLDTSPVAQEVPLELETEEEHALFRVRDTGIGIAAENLGKIFEPFSQAEQGNTRTVGGTGLGLAVSRSIMELLGGTLQVESTPGGGTTFTACLPLQPA